MKFCFRWVREERPGARWLALFERAWPSYRRWFLQEGDDARPDLAACRRALGRHMPELLPLWAELVDLSGGSEEVARMLGLYCPTPYMSGCSQAFWTRGTPMLVRNYDFHPTLCEGTFLRSRWLGSSVIAASDCLWGVLDGINERGLAVALAFGGSRVVGEGFGIPLILRYVLETCESTLEAIAVLRRVPSHMVYNVSVLDASGERAVVFVGPDRQAVIASGDVATNHQQPVEWRRYHRLSRSAERGRFLEDRLGDETVDADSFVALFLRPPLHKADYGGAFGTLYTASYCPASTTAEFLWPAGRVAQSMDGFEERELVVRFPTSA